MATQTSTTPINRDEELTALRQLYNVYDTRISISTTPTTCVMCIKDQVQAILLTSQLKMHGWHGVIRSYSSLNRCYVIHIRLNTAP